MLCLQWPSWLRINGVDIPIMYQELVGPTSSPQSGEYDPTAGTITICSLLAAKLKFNTLIHEALHAWWSLCLKDDATLDEESFVSLGAGALSQLLFDNPALVHLASALAGFGTVERCVYCDSVLGGSDEVGDSKKDNRPGGQSGAVPDQVPCVPDVVQGQYESPPVGPC